MRIITPFLANSRPKTCSGCGNSFVIRNGQAEVIVGPDGRLYCYGTVCDHAAFAAAVIAFKRAFLTQGAAVAPNGRSWCGCPGMADFVEKVCSPALQNFFGVVGAVFRERRGGPHGARPS